MTWKNRVSPLPIVTTSVFVGLVGLITFGCTNFVADAEQQPIRGKNSPSINTPSENFLVNQGDNNLTINTSSQAIVAEASQRVFIQKNMVYSEARKLIIKQGWRPNLEGELPNLRDSTVRKLFKLGYEEVKDCSGTGEGPCLFEFINQKGELLTVVTTTMGSNNGNRFVTNWWVEKKSNITQQSSSNEIAEGLYWLGGTDQGLEIQGQQYRYYDEVGKKPWQSISNLKYVTNGVIFDGKIYWCLSTLAPQNQVAVCSAKGWKSQ